jgi:hypothetical protein
LAKKQRGTIAALELARPDDYEERSPVPNAPLALYGSACYQQLGDAALAQIATPKHQTDRVLAQFWHSSNAVKREDKLFPNFREFFEMLDTRANEVAVRRPVAFGPKCKKVGSPGELRRKPMRRKRTTKRTTQTFTTPMTGVEALEAGRRTYEAVGAGSTGATPGAPAAAPSAPQS